MPTFSKITDDKRRHLDLLLLADEQEDMVYRYLDRGDMWTLDDDGTRGICVVTDEGDGILEIKNLAITPDSQRQGYGKAMIEFIATTYGAYKTLRVGTGDSPLTIPFYESCGFRKVGRLANFFTENYDHPIIEGGAILTDMIVLERQL